MTITEATQLATDFTPEELELQERARRFVDQVLIPHEEEAELAGGKISEELHARIKEEAVEARLSGGLHSPEYGGQGWTKTEWFLVEEQLGRSTNALSWHMPGAYNVLASGTPQQIERYLKPRCGGELHDATRDRGEAGSDRSIATPLHDRFRLGDRGEKWFGHRRPRGAVHREANAQVADESRPTCSSSTADGTASRSSTDRHHHTYQPWANPGGSLHRCRVPDDAVSEHRRRRNCSGWFTEERLGIAARGVGSMWRLIEETTAWALGREQGGNRIMDYQGVSFPLADSAADAAAGRLLTLEVARLVDAGADPKLVHAKASMAKLFVARRLTVRDRACRSSAGAAT